MEKFAKGRRNFLKFTGAGVAWAIAGVNAFSAQLPNDTKPNVLFITVDDMNYDSIGCYGCEMENITPHIDKLATEGIRFKYGHVTSPLCMPSRQCLLTGRYPFNNKALGFTPINPQLETLPERLKQGGYFTGMFGKLRHHKPKHKFPMDVREEFEFSWENGYGRSFEVDYKLTKDFISEAKKEDKPWFLKVNILDPHRPFPGYPHPKDKAFGDYKSALAVDDPYEKSEVDWPEFIDKDFYPWNKPFWPKLNDAVPAYYDAVHRADKAVGKVLQALDESGDEKNTLVIFLSDHGMPFRRAKASLYNNGTRTPVIVRWPGKTKPGTVDRGHLISGIDFTPTILDILGLPAISDADGISFKEALLGQKIKGMDCSLTVLDKNIKLTDKADPEEYEDCIRAVNTKRYGYIFNPWYEKDKLKTFHESRISIEWFEKKMVENPEEVHPLLKFYYYRSLEELYDYHNDPDALNNIADDPRYKDVLNDMRKRMYMVMKESGDILLSEFKRRVYSKLKT